MLQLLVVPVGVCGLHWPPLATGHTACFVLPLPICPLTPHYSSCCVLSNRHHHHSSHSLASLAHQITWGSWHVLPHCWCCLPRALAACCVTSGWLVCGPCCGAGPSLTAGPAQLSYGVLLGGLHRASLWWLGGLASAGHYHCTCVLPVSWLLGRWSQLLGSGAVVLPALLLCRPATAHLAVMLAIGALCVVLQLWCWGPVLGGPGRSCASACHVASGRWHVVGLAVVLGPTLGPLNSYGLKIRLDLWQMATHG